MSRFIFVLLIFSFATVPTSAFLKDTNFLGSAKKVCEKQPNYPEQELILTFSCNNEKVSHIVKQPGHLKSDNSPRVMITINLFFAIVNLLCMAWINKRIKKYAGYVLLPIEYIRKIGLNNPDFPINDQFMELLTLNESNDLEEDNETTSIVNTNIDEYGTEDPQPSSNSNKCDTSIASSLRKRYVPGISSTKPSNILLETPNGIDEYSSLQHYSADEPESNTMGVSALVENKNDSRLESPKRGRNQLQKSKQGEKNLSRSVSQESSQSNYSSSTDSYSNVRLSENECQPSVNAFLSFGRTSSAYDLLPNVHEKRNEPSYHQETWEHIDSQISSKNDALLLHESTVIRSRRHTVIGFNDEYSRIVEDLRLNEVKRSCRSISSHQQSYSFSTPSHEDISQLSRDRFLPNDAMSYCTEQNGTHTPLSVVFARIDETLRNIGRIRSVQNDEDQSSERSLSIQSDLSFPTASLRSDDASSLGSSVNSSNSNLSNDSGITNSRSDVEEINE